MTHEERRIWLIKKLLSERIEYRNYKIPDDEKGQKDMLRSLMNVRMPHFISDEFLQIQDEYLQVENAKDGFVDIDELTPVKSDSRLYLWQGDITRLKVDVIVNAANSQMLGCFQPLHGCIDNCIHTFAGVQLRAECNKQMNELRIRYGRDYEQPTAVPMITDAYNLPARKVIHIVGPIVQYKLTPELEKNLEDCYKNTLDMCAENGLRSVAFCCISTGVFRFPNKKAAEIAVKTVSEWLSDNPGKVERVIFNVFKDEDKAIYEKLI